MRRRLLKPLTVLSLLLCVAVCVLWVRSHIVSDDVELHVASRGGLIAREWTVHSNRGVFGIVWVRRSFDTSAGFEYYLHHLPHESKFRRLIYSTRSPYPREERSNPFLGLMGFAADSAYETKDVPRRLGTFTIDRTLVEMPYWLAVLLASAPLLHKVKVRLPRGKSNASRACAACGYDLRATPDRCPECGTQPPPVPSR